MLTKIVPKKSLGQHFLVNPRILDKIIAAAEITKDDIVLEVGPGTGNLTKKLAEKAKRVIAIEKDRRLIGFLKDKLSENSAIAGKSEIIEGDVLKLDSEHSDVFGSLGSRPYKIVANIPYYITSRFIRTIFEKWPKPKLIVLTIQKEVAQRIMASPPHSKLSVGARPPKMNLLALSVQFYSNPKIISYISKENFRPRPKVDSAITKLIPKEKLPIPIINDLFFKAVRAGFQNKRKQLVGNLSKKFGIMKEEISEIFGRVNIQRNTRAENLSLNKWVELTEYLKKLFI